MSSRQQHNENEDDAMFTKKPLGGMSCASCEKNIINMYGHKADYLPWSRFPFRDPSERIAKVGQGFSKMLSMINPDSLTRFESHSKFSTTNINHGGIHQTYYEDGHHGESEKKGKHLFPGGTATKTSQNFYPAGTGPLGQVDEQARAGLSTASGATRLRPTSATVKKQIPVSYTILLDIFTLINRKQTASA